MTASGSEKLAKKLVELRHRERLTQEQLAERSGFLDAHTGVSVDTIRALESLKNLRPLPKRQPPRGHFAVELVIKALNGDLVDILTECFTDSELRDSSFSWVVDKRAEDRERVRDVISMATLRDFVNTLPSESEHLLRIPGLLQLQNESAFAYIFALERCYPGLEMLVLNEPPIILLDNEDIASWADGMNLNGADKSAFHDLIIEYQDYFKGALTDNNKRYQIVLWKTGLRKFLLQKRKSAAAATIDNMMSFLRLPNFELVLFESPDPLDELEVISVHRSIPTSFEDTLSVVIRQTPMSSRQVEYSLIPMPPSISGLHRDIARIEAYWSLALDQYSSIENRNFDKRRYWLTPSDVTFDLLQELKESI